MTALSHHVEELAGRGGAANGVEEGGGGVGEAVKVVLRGLELLQEGELAVDDQAAEEGDEELALLEELGG